jgi:hypothetical protein
VLNDSLPQSSKGGFTFSSQGRLTDNLSNFSLEISKKLFLLECENLSESEWKNCEEEPSRRLAARFVNLTWFTQGSLQTKTLFSKQILLKISPTIE